MTSNNSLANNLPDNPPLPIARPPLSEMFMQHAMANGDTVPFMYQQPDHVVTFTVAPDETIMSFTKVVAGLLPERTADEAAAFIAEYNNLDGPADNPDWQSQPLNRKELAVPMPRDMEIAHFTVDGAAGASSIAKDFNDLGLVPDSLLRNPDATAGFVQSLNLDMPYDPLDNQSIDKISIKRDINFVTTNDFAHFDQLAAPSGDIRRSPATLFIVEPMNGQDGASHGKMAFEYALNFGAALTPHNERPAIYPISESDFSRTNEKLWNLPSANANEYVVFSHSYGYEKSFPGYYGNPGEANLKNVHFIAAGNAHEIPGMEGVAAANNTQIGGRSYTVGAVHTYSNQNFLAHYSSAGADILAPPIPLHDGKLIHGTSFSTPMMAALDREMLDMYGSVLTQEEIMAAAFMSTDMDLKDSPVTGVEPVKFNTNGGGQPHNDRAGAGMIDQARWQQNLETMATMKQRMEYVPDMVHQQSYPTDSGVEITTAADGTPRYNYQITFEQDMTLDRQSFILPTDNHKQITDLKITSPSGFSYESQGLAINARATSAFTMEDVKAGDVMTITTNEPLSSFAAVAIRGHGDGNVIQTLRDHLQENGMMPKPLTEYTGATPTAELQAPSSTLSQIWQNIFGGNDNAQSAPQGNAPTTNNDNFVLKL